VSLNISAVERDTGLSKDTLRMWERRYGFPAPERDANGERVYPPEQLEKLQLIKRLMDRGHRPGNIILRSLSELALLDGASAQRETPSPEIQALLARLRDHEIAQLRAQLTRLLISQGLRAFVIDTIAQLNRAVGEAWMRGELAVFEEHLYTGLAHGVLRSAITALPQSGLAPRVLLTSLPNEPHGLGLLMVEALLTLEGATCIALGTETPMPEIVRAAAAHRVHIVALSFSAGFNERAAAAGLQELRALLDPRVQIWAGGSGLARWRRQILGVQIICDLTKLAAELNDWRPRHAEQC